MLEHVLIALALHCGRGEMYRVHLHKCVAKTSSLARGFEHRPRHPAPAAKACCYVDAVIAVRPDEAVPAPKIQELAKDQPHIWIIPDTSTPRQSLTFEQTSKLWRWLVSTIPQP